MKTSTKLTTLFIVCILIPFLTIGQTTNTHVITLNVETQQIVNPEIDEFCNFGQAEDTENKDFTIEANVGDVIMWKGVSSDAPSTDAVKIVSIDHESGTNFFGTGSLDNNGQDFVLGVIKSGNAGEEQKYTLRFTVFNGTSQRNGIFVIDPKIKILN